MRPLRAARRALKPPLPGIGDGDREDLRADVKAAELHAERILLEALERLSGGAGDGAVVVPAALPPRRRLWDIALNRSPADYAPRKLLAVAVRCAYESYSVRAAAEAV